MTTPIVTELRRNGNTMVERPTAKRRPPTSRLPERASQTQPRRTHSPAAPPYRPVHRDSHNGHRGTVRSRWTNTTTTTTKEPS
jgi:hypothetical protein